MKNLGINLKKRTSTLVKYGRPIDISNTVPTKGSGTDTTNTTFTILTTSGIFIK